MKTAENKSNPKTLAFGRADDLKLNVTPDALVPGGTRSVGFVQTIVKQAAQSLDNATVIFCVPPVMIKFISSILEELGFPPKETFLSLEKRMRSDIGKCGRCNR